MSLALTPSQGAVRCEFLAFLLVGMGLRLRFSSLTIGQTLLKGVVLTGLCPSTTLLPPQLCSFLLTAASLRQLQPTSPPRHAALARAEPWPYSRARRHGCEGSPTWSRTRPHAFS